MRSIRNGSRATTLEHGATLSDDGRYRYTLTRRWRSGGKTVCWVMLNPSTADANIDDPTIRRCINFSQAWDYGGLVVVNLFPYRSSSPVECHSWYEQEAQVYFSDRTELYRNMRIVDQQAQSADLVVAAWGAVPWALRWSTDIMKMLTLHRPLYCIGETLNRDPKHPMARGKHRVPDHVRPEVWQEART